MARTRARCIAVGIASLRIGKYVVIDLLAGLVGGAMCGGIFGFILPLALAQCAVRSTGDSSAGGFAGVLIILTVPICAFVGSIIGVLISARALRRK
jgi:hypothetical protein